MAKQLQHSDFPFPSPVLHFDECVLPLTETDSETFTVQLTVDPGELVMVHTPDRFHEDALSRAASGLIAPLSGSVLFRGKNWRGLSPDRANAARGRIGVVFRNESWIPHQTILETLILPQLHHTHLPIEVICNDAARWASRFGLPGIPEDLPAAMTARDRQSANLARGFVGDPVLVIVEHQVRTPPVRLREALVNAIRDVRERNAAVLWFSRNVSLCLDSTLPATRRLRLGGDALTILEPAA